MLTVVVVMVLILGISAVVLAYVAYPHRGEEMPVAPVVGEAMRRGVDSLQTLGGADDENSAWVLDGEPRR